MRGKFRQSLYSTTQRWARKVKLLAVRRSLKSVHLACWPSGRPAPRVSCVTGAVSLEKPGASGARRVPEAAGSAAGIWKSGYGKWSEELGSGFGRTDGSDLSPSGRTGTCATLDFRRPRLKGTAQHPKRPPPGGPWSRHLPQTRCLRQKDARVPWNGMVGIQLPSYFDVPLAHDRSRRF